MKPLIIIALLVATEINSTSCDGRNNIRQEMIANSQASLKACQDRGGVPIWQTNYDAADMTYFQTVSNCILQPVVAHPEQR